jgi:hypothetical protein
MSEEKSAWDQACEVGESYAPLGALTDAIWKYSETATKGLCDSDWGYVDVREFVSQLIWCARESQSASAQEALDRLLMEGDGWQGTIDELFTAARSFSAEEVA